MARFPGCLLLSIYLKVVNDGQYFIGVRDRIVGLIPKKVRRILKNSRYVFPRIKLLMIQAQGVPDVNCTSSVIQSVKLGLATE